MKKHLNSIKSISKLFITYEIIIVNKYVQGMSEMKKKCEHFCSYFECFAHNIMILIVNSNRNR